MRLIETIEKGDRKTVKAIIDYNSQYVYIEASMPIGAVPLTELVNRQAELIAELEREPIVFPDGRTEVKKIRYVTASEARNLCYPKAKDQLVQIFLDKINTTDNWKDLIQEIRDEFT